jgi:hypothetical protein
VWLERSFLVASIHHGFNDTEAHVQIYIWNHDTDEVVEHQFNISRRQGEQELKRLLKKYAHLTPVEKTAWGKAQDKKRDLQ